jgi:heme/copper-type cytochrome/quinol oxidase subunit 2
MISIVITATLLMLVIVLPVIAMVFAFAWKYQASDDCAPYTLDRKQFAKVAAAIVAGPCIIVVVLGIVAWKRSHELDPDRPLASKAEPVTIEVVALDWKWLFIYPDLAAPSENNSDEYFSSVDPALYREILRQSAPSPSASRSPFAFGGRDAAPVLEATPQLLDAVMYFKRGSDRDRPGVFELGVIEPYIASPRYY